LPSEVNVSFEPTKRAVLAVVAAVALFVSSAGADAALPDSVKARQLFKLAEVQYGMGQFEKALVLYQEALRSFPLSGFHFNIAQCHRNLNQHERAIFHFKQYLARSPDATNRDTVQKLIEVSERALRAAATDKPPGAAVAPRPPPAEERRPTAEAAPASAPVSAPVPATRPEEPARPPSGRRRISPALFWTGVGLTAALLVVGTGTGAAALARNSEYKDHAATADRRQELKDSGQSLSVASTVSFGLAGAVGVGTAVLYWFTDFRPRRAELSAAPLHEGGLLVMKGRF
jgi:tetratricopeptide (TPR) repeat protein